MLLGTDGVCIISHGSSSPAAITNAIGVARDMVVSDVVGRIASAIADDGSA
jgi:glycerol-3-phosphate acyltransferase PlsX